jgi:hypothetical protein
VFFSLLMEILCIKIHQTATSELRADADLSAGHGEEGADGVRRGRRSDGRAPPAAPSAQDVISVRFLLLAVACNGRATEVRPWPRG